MLSINTNTPAMMAQNNVSQTQDNMTTSMERLSTGLRINSASDDAAGMQIANRMETQINGMDVAMRNANDAVSMAQTAEGAMVETSNMMNRMRDLSLQAANDTNTQEDRDAMQEEVDQLTSQIDDTARQTNFAGTNLLDGSADSLTFQVGANAGETISFGISSMFADDLGKNIQTADSALALTTAGTVDAAEALTVNDADGNAQTLTFTDATDIDDAVKQTNDFLADNDVDLTAVAKEDGTGIDLVGTSETMTDQSLTGAGLGGVGNINISTAEGAQKATVVLDSALAEVDAERAELGATQNRLDYTIANLQNTQENLTTSQSRIQDVDFAKETTELTKNQMMMQAGTTVLAQTKQMPQYAVQMIG